jgi:hypothetical protein
MYRSRVGWVTAHSDSALFSLLHKQGQESHSGASVCVSVCVLSGDGVNIDGVWIGTRDWRLSLSLSQSTVTLQLAVYRQSVRLGRVFSEYFGFPCQLHSTKLSINIITRGRLQKANQWPPCRVDPVGLHPPLRELLQHLRIYFDKICFLIFGLPGKVI